MCHSSSCRSQAILASTLLSEELGILEPPLSLYRQWAATPYSETLCISKVRIWISRGCPLEATTVVWRDW